MCPHAGRAILAVMPADPENARVIERHDIHEDLAVFAIAPADGSDAPDFAPGQYATLGLPDPAHSTADRVKLIRRMYSIASPATRQDRLEFYIVRVDGGALTPSLFDLAAGDRLHMSGRCGGHFTLSEHAAGKTLVLVGTGTGTAPYRSMLHTHRDDPPWDHLVLIEGCRLARDLGYRAEFEALAETDERFTYLPTVTREPDDSDWPGLRGRVPALLEADRFRELTGRELAPDSAHVYLCGNPAMIDQCEADLLNRGFVTQDRKHPEGNLHFERYW